MMAQEAALKEVANAEARRLLGRNRPSYRADVKIGFESDERASSAWPREDSTRR